MSMSGGVSGSVGGQQQPFTEDLKATAAATNMKAVLNLTTDTLDQPFTKLGGEHNLWKYQASPGRPTLHPLVTVRGAGAEEARPDESWKNLYQQLAERLGPEIQDRLNEENKIPFDSKDPTYIVLDNLLTNLAKAVVWLELAAATPDVNSIQSVKALDNLAMPTTVFNEMGNDVKFLLGNAGPYLVRDSANPNYFDQNVNMLKQTAIAHRSMQNAYSSTTTENGVDPQTRSALLANNMALLGDQFNKLDFGPDLSIIRNNWNVMTTVAAAKSLDQGPSALMLGLTFATSGIYSSNSPSGFVGPALENLINQLSGGLTSAFLPESTKGGQALLSEIVTAALIVCVSAAALIAQDGLGSSGAVELDSASAKAFSFDLVMHLFASTGVLNTFFEKVGGLIGASGESLQMLSTALPVALMAMMLLYGGQLQGETGNLVNSLNDPLYSGIAKTGDTLGEKIAQGTGDSQQTNAVDVGLQQAKMALEDQDAPAFLGAITTMLEQQGISQTQLQQDLAQITKTTSSIQRSFTEGMFNQTNLTGITQAA